MMVSETGSGLASPKHHRRTIMEHYAGIDVSLELSSVCVVDATGRIVREAKVASEPEALIGWLRGHTFSHAITKPVALKMCNVYHLSLGGSRPCPQPTEWKST